MLRLALASIPESAVWTAEIDRASAGEPTYWIDTLREARSRTADDLRFLIGADQAVAFHRWRSAREVLEVAPPVVLPRGSVRSRDQLVSALDAAGQWSPEELERWGRWFAPTSVLDVAATAIREKLSQRQAPIDALDPAVHAYIQRHQLYAPVTDPRA